MTPGHLCLRKVFSNSKSKSSVWQQFVTLQDRFLRIRSSEISGLHSRLKN